MIPIHQKKIAAIGPPPVWTPFQGFSLLFDHPGAHLIPHESGRKLMQVNPLSPEVSLYHRISSGLAMLGLEKWGTQAAFCALPANSYHVTAWDGVNINNLESVAASDRADFQQLLEDLPGSLDSPLLDLIYQSDLMKWKDWHIEFQFAQLSTWRNKVIAIELQPADTKSAHHFQHFISLRQQLSHQFIDRYQLLTTAKEFVPHVTLGYFANMEAGAQAAPMLEQHREAFREIMAPARLSFRSLSLYGLTDMASFYR